MRDGIEWMADQAADACSQTVTYSRPATSQSVSLAAVPARVSAVVQTPAGQQRVFTGELDFIVRAEDIVLGGATVAPQRGDRIVMGTETFSVEPMAGEPHYRKSDSYGLRFRIHTRKVT